MAASCAMEQQIQYTTLLTLLAITFSFPFAHTERENKEERKEQVRIQINQKEEAETPTLPPPLRMKTSFFRTCSNKVTLTFQKHCENARKKGGPGPPRPPAPSAPLL